MALFTPQGATAGTANGDYISDTNGLGTYYSYFIEVPANLARLQVDLFDADVGLGGSGEAAAQRDRSRGAGYNTSFAYTLLDPSGTSVATMTGDATQPTGADNAWLGLYDTYNASAAPAFGTSSTATQGTDAASITIAPPGSTAAGDLLLLVVNKDGGSDINTPGGWTLVNGGDCDSSACHLAVFYKIATSSEPANYTISWVSGSEQAVAGILRYTGANTTAPIDVSGAATGDSAAPQAPSVTTTVDNTRIVRIYGADDDDLSGTPYPGSHTGRFNIESNTGAGTASGGAADATQAADGATGAASFALSAGEQWRAVTVAIRGTPASLPNGHWELRADAGSGDDINALGIRAHDGTPGSGGTELPIYYDSHTSVGVNPNGTQSRTYDVFPWVTSACTASHNDFDYDSDDAADVGNNVFTSRTSAFTQTIDNNALSVDDSWNRDTITTWTSDADSTEYGIWRQDVEINTYGSGPSGNYAVLYVGSSALAANPPTQPMANAYRVYLPTDASTTTAPVKPYLEQQIRYDASGGSGAGVGDYRVYGVTVRLVNPTAHALTFASSGTTGNVVIANVPGSGAVYIGSSAAATQGTITSQPANLGTGNVVWAPGTVAAGDTEVLSYSVRLGPFTSGGRIVATGTPTASGTTAAYVDETGNTSQSRATYTLGPLCELAATQGVTDYVLLTRLEAVAVDGRVVLEWDTASEVGTAGFLVYRRDPHSGDWLLLHDGLLPASPDAPEGGTYRFLDPGAAIGEEQEYLLAEIDLSGAATYFGPSRLAAVSRRDGSRALDTEFAFTPHAPPPAAARAEREASPPPIVTGNTAPTALKLLVRERGLYYVSANEIAQGLEVAASDVRARIETAQFKLTWRTGQVDWLPAAGGNGLYFFANPTPSQFAADDVYRLAPAPGRLMRMQSARPHTRPRVTTAFSEQLLLEQERFAATALPLDSRSDYWFWEALLAGHPTVGTRNVAIELPNPTSSGPLTLKVRLQSATNFGTPGEHRAVVALNGVTLGARDWSGRQAVELQLDAPAELLLPGRNTLTLTAEGTPGAVFYLNEVVVDYERTATAVANELFVRSLPNTLAEIDGFEGGELWVLDLAQWRRPIWLFDHVVEGSSNSWRTRFAATAGGRYYALSERAVRRPTAIVPDWPVPSSSTGADYLVIAGSALVDAARDLADYREQQGLRTMVVDVADVWDHYNYGRPDPAAIQAFVRDVYRGWQQPPRFVLLVGDGSFDFRDLRGYGGNHVPPLMVTTPYGIFAADGAYADVVGDDSLPDLPIGRLPAQSPNDVARYLDHVRDYESGPPELPYDLLLISDNPDGAADFGAQHERLRLSVAGRYVLDHLDLTTLDLPTVRQDLHDYTHAGTSVINYLGHGGSSQLAEEGIMTRADVANLTNGRQLFVLSALTCTLNRFELPGTSTLGEDLVLAPSGGAGVVWSASGLSLHTAAAELGQSWLDVLRQNISDHVGELTLQALRDYLAGPNADASAVVSMNVLGDPALLLRLSDAPPPEPPDDGGNTSTGE